MQYIGESARTGWDRGRNHADSVSRGQIGDPIVDHYAQNHPGQEMDFEMRIIKFEDKNLHRQASEGYIIVYL